MQLVSVQEDEFYRLFKLKKGQLALQSNRTRDNRRRNVLESNYLDSDGVIRAQVVRNCRGKFFYVRKDWFNETD